MPPKLVQTKISGQSRMCLFVVKWRPSCAIRSRQRAQRCRVLSAGTLPTLLRRLGIAAVPHGFRSSFRDWAAECTDTPHAVMESALAHVVRNKAEAAYARSDLFERRRVLMDDWAAYLATERRDPEAGPSR